MIARLRLSALVTALAGAGLLLGSATALEAKEPKVVEHVVVFVGPSKDAPDAVRASESLRGLRAAFDAPGPGDAKATLSTLDIPAQSGSYMQALKGLAKRKPAPSLVVAWAADGTTTALETAAAKAKLPLLVLSPEPTTPALDPGRATFWAGGQTRVDAAIAALDFALQPLGSRRPLLLHDGSARARAIAETCTRVHHLDQSPIAPLAIDGAFDAKRLRSLVGTAEGGAPDALLYFGGPPGANRLLALVEETACELPVLLGESLVSDAVPAFAEGRAPNAWALAPVYFEDYRGPAGDAAEDLAAAATRAERPAGAARPIAVRAYRAGRWILEALETAESTKPKHVVPLLQGLGRIGAAGKPVFELWGHASLPRSEPWRSAAIRDDPACHRVRHTLMPIEGIPQIGFFPTKRFQWEPGTHYVHCTFGDGAKRTIEKNLKAIGLSTGGYEEDLEQRILDDLLGRVMSRLSIRFHRNADGSAIPGVSYNVSFTAEPPPTEGKRRIKKNALWTVIIQGDHAFAGGEVIGDGLAAVYSTFIVRTIYEKHKLDPVLAQTDRPYLSGRYRWGTSVAENLRGDLLRSLHDGFAGSMALTGAHELGHIAGCGHDEASPRSIMNVAEGAGLEFLWAEWVPQHRKLIEKRVGLAR